MRYLLFTLPVLVACQSAPLVVGPTLAQSPVSGKQLASAKQTVEIDKFLLSPCRLPPRFDNKKPTDVDVLNQKAAENVVIAECYAKQRQLSNLVKKAFNIGDAE